MLRTARLTEAMRAHGRTLAVSAAVAGALAGVGSAAAQAATTPSTTHHVVGAQDHRAKRNSTGPYAVAPTTALSEHQAPLYSTGHKAPAATSTHTSAPTQHATPLAAPAPVQHATPVAAPAPAPAQHATPVAAPAPAPAQHAAPAPQPAPQPHNFYDAVTPSAIPAGQQAAVYSNGSYAATPAQVAGHPNTLWIDTNGSNPKANALDVEPGDATPQQAAGWVWQKLHSNPNQTAIVYTMRSEWGAAQQAMSTLPQPMQSHVKWWIADPTGVPHVVPGSDATQWYWGQNYDESTANAGF